MSVTDPRRVKEIIEALEVQKNEIDIALKVIKRLPAFQVGESAFDEVLRVVEIESRMADSSRKEQIQHLMRRVGPHTRKAIIDRTGIPPGSVDAALNDKSVFYRLDDGTWDLVRASVNG